MTHDFKCTSCDHVFELFLKISEEVRADCPLCHSACEKVWNGVAPAALRLPFRLTSKPAVSWVKPDGTSVPIK